MATSKYQVIARLSASPTGRERQYVMMEKEMAKREFDRLPERTWMPFSWPGMGLLRRKDWHDYLHTLDRYDKALARHQGEIDGGLLPLKFDVLHEGDEPDTQIRVHIMVHHGSFHLAKRAPERPKRIDGAPNKGNENRFRGFTGFVRSGIHIGRHGVEAVFSKLGAEDSAAVVAQPLYLDIGPNTGLSYEIHSRNLPHGQHGEVIVDYGR